MELQPIEIASQFCPLNASIDGIEPLGNGRINDTYLVRLLAPYPSFVLQRINSQVFAAPEQVMHNLMVFTQHAKAKLPSLQLLRDRRWEIPQVLTTTVAQFVGQPFTYDSSGSLWRAISYIDRSISLDTIQTTAQAREVGIALGIFHCLLSDLSSDLLADTLEGFHITPQYLAQYDAAIAAGIPAAAKDKAADCMHVVEECRRWASVLEDAKVAGFLKLRPIHGDPKVNNILFDPATEQAIGFIDLDTVKPGLVHYDIGDCLRSGCNPAGSNARHLSDVRFHLPNFQAIVRGYWSIAREFLSERDREYFYDAIRLIPFELGLRYLTDYLMGIRYFKVSHPEEALYRARVQFALGHSIKQQADVIKREIECLAGEATSESGDSV